MHLLGAKRSSLSRLWHCSKVKFTWTFFARERILTVLQIDTSICLITRGLCHIRRKRLWLCRVHRILLLLLIAGGLILPPLLATTRLPLLPSSAADPLLANWFLLVVQAILMVDSRASARPFGQITPFLLGRCSVVTGLLCLGSIIVVWGPLGDWARGRRLGDLRLVKLLSLLLNRLEEPFIILSQSTCIVNWGGTGKWRLRTLDRHIIVGCIFLAPFWVLLTN